MRVIAGYLGGQNFDSPSGHRTHPMSEKSRGAIFNALGDIKGLSALDAFSGSGAIAIEAVSRGALSVQALESDSVAHSTIKSNLSLLKIDKVQATKAFVKSWSNRHPNEKFDLIFADPPYDDIPYKDVEVLPKHLKSDGILILSWPPSLRLPLFGTLQVVQSKEYGDSQLVFYKHIS